LRLLLFIYFLAPFLQVIVFFTNIYLSNALFSNSKKIVEKWGSKPLMGKKIEQLPEFSKAANTLHLLPGQNKKAYQNFVTHLEDNKWVLI